MFLYRNIDSTNQFNHRISHFIDLKNAQVLRIYCVLLEKPFLLRYHNIAALVSCCRILDSENYYKISRLTWFWLIWKSIFTFFAKPTLSPF
jgi:hypothetical protein